MRSFTTIFLIFFLLKGIVFCQPKNINSSLLQKPWNAYWITGPGKQLNMWNAHTDATLRDYGVYKFRKSFELTAIPTSFIIHVSADNRYKLFINEKLVSLGPARGDLYFWNFETVDIAHYLNPGKNTVAALVWNDGKLKPEAQISYLTAFILQGNTTAEEIINTNNSWLTIKDSSYQPIAPRVPGYYVAGPGENLQMKYYIRGWEKTEYDDSKWEKARTIMPGLTKDAARDSRGWMLVPSPLPQMEMITQRLSLLRKAENVSVPAGFPSTKIPVTIPAKSKVVLLLDQANLTNAYPTLVFSKGKDAGISIGYAEALYIRNNENIDGAWVPTLPKGNRNEVEGKTFIGKKDSIISDGSDQQTFTSLWWRTFRYIQLKVETQDEPLVIEDIYGTFTGYPFQNRTKLETGDESHKKILDIGWRTARLCATETYMDCPYYEQLQYIGDTRIQALVSLYNDNDDRLVRNAITLMDHSRIAEGITLSRYPTDLHQQIPTFSLWWICMLHDYWMYRTDADFIKKKLPGERQVLDFFHRYQQPNGSLKDLPYWIFTDWVDGRKGWSYGEAPVGSKGESSVLDLQLMWTYRLAAEMEAKIGLMDFARIYNERAAQLKRTIQSKYWDPIKKMYADTEAKDVFSQHANSLAILTGMVNAEDAIALSKKLLKDTSLAPASIYFKYYLHQALIKSGLGNDYMDWLDKWHENIQMGLTTWGESSDVSTTRSDCHAWGSSPNIEFFRTVLGIDSESPGFSKVKIEPHLGKLEKAGGEIPHPAGKIAVQYKLNEGKWKMEIELPPGISGRLVWKKKSYPLKEGKNSLTL